MNWDKESLQIRWTVLDIDVQVSNEKSENKRSLS